MWGSLCAVLATVGCAGGQRQRDATNEPALSNLPFVYKMTIQQGNLVTADLLDQLKPGMSRGQVRYLLGTPLLTDPFHADRWDYSYTIKRGHEPMEIRRLTLYFEQDVLARIEGHLRPDPTRLQAAENARERVVAVPDWEDNSGLIQRMLRAAGVQKVD